MEDILIAPDKVEITDMRRHWWIKYKWYGVAEAGSKTIIYTKLGLRPIEEVAKAAAEFDLFTKAFKYG